MTEVIAIRDPRWARITSNVLSPPAVWALLGYPVAFAYTSNIGEALAWGTWYGVLVGLIPLLFVVYLLKSGKISDLHIQVRKERTLPFIVSVICTAIAGLSMYWLNVPHVFPLIAFITCIELIVITMITLKWQISFHTMSITSAVLMLTFVFGIVWGFILIPAIMLVAAARLRLHRHTPIQLIAGVLLGGLVPVIVLYALNLVFPVS